MKLAMTTIVVLSTFCSVCTAQQEAVDARAFPASTARAEGLDPKALAKLHALVERFVREDDIIGAELLVIKNGRRVLHEGYGWRDRETQTPMKPGSVFCVRSMTKPLISTAVGMLLDDGLIALGDPVAKYLPAFDVGTSRSITVEQLLTHTSGLPMSLLGSGGATKLEGIRALAERGAGHALESLPGTAFHYSDQGTDTLTALVEVVSGMAAENFIRKRVLDPLGMHDSACVLAKSHALRPRVVSKYAGTRGSWTRFWGADDAPLFPFFLGSQGLYTTAADYARFMQLWLDGGRVARTRLLSAAYVDKALTKSPFPMESSTALPDMRVGYGFLMQLWASKQGDGDDGDLVAFGHSGSDGTWAWAFPAAKAMVLYFTQSRGNRTGLRVEEALGELFLGVEVDTTNLDAPLLEPYLGYYAEDEGSRYQAIVRDGDDLALETPGRALRHLVHAGEDRWKFRDAPSVLLTFERSTDGEVIGFRIGDQQKAFRVRASRDLPSVEEIATRIVNAHRLDLLETLGPMRTRSALTIASRGIKGRIMSLVAWPDRYREDSLVGEEWEQFVVDGGRVWTGTKTRPAEEILGTRATLLRTATTFARFGDWRRTHPRLEVIQRIVRRGKSVFVVRAGDTSLTAPTYDVDTESGRLLREERITQIDGLGRVGQSLTFGSFRDVSGMLLPHRTTIEIAHPWIGRIQTRVETIELGVDLPADAFVVRTDRPNAPVGREPATKREP